MINFTFETFVEDATNKEALQKCKALFDSTHKPTALWIYGPSGCGKTHLLKAVYNSWISSKNPKVNGVYTNAEDLNTLFYKTFKGEGDEFEKLQESSFLIVDNLEHLKGMTINQMAFADLLHDISVKGKPVIVASECKPNDLQDFKLFFNHELDIVEVKKPGVKLKRTILNSFLEKNKLPISEECKALIIKKSKNIPYLQGMLNYAKCFCSLPGFKVDEAWVKGYNCRKK